MFKYIRPKNKDTSLPIITTIKKIEETISGPCRILLLPVELQIRIFVLAQNPALAIVSKQFYELGQSDTVRAQYLIQRYSPIAVLGKQAMSRKIVSLGVVEHILRLNFCNPKADGEYWLFTKACELNQVNLCQWIIESALSMEAIENERKRTLFHLLNIAAMKGAIPIIDLLVDTFGVDIHRGKEDTLTLACKENHVDTVKHLVSKYGCDVHVNNEIHLRNACLYAHKQQLIKYLLDIGSDVHVYGDAALQNAVYNGHAAIVKLLLDAGADPTTNQHVCIRHAITKRDVQSFKYLVAAGADPRCDGDWPFRHACQMGLDEIVLFLMQVIPVKDVMNIQDGMLLKECLMYGRMSTIKLLLDHGANPNSVGAIRGLRYALSPKSKIKDKDAMIHMLTEAGLDLTQLHHLLSSSISDTEIKPSLSWI